MAEVDPSPARAAARAGEAPGKARNRRLRYQERRGRARTTRELLAAAADYFRATFSGYPPERVQEICDRLVEHTDSERSKSDGTQ